MEPSKQGNWSCRNCKGARGCQHICLVEAALVEGTDDIVPYLEAAINKIWKTRKVYVPVSLSTSPVPFDVPPHHQKTNRQSLRNHLNLHESSGSYILIPNYQRMCLCGELFPHQLDDDWLVGEAIVFTLSDMLPAKGKTYGN